jgi:hypothetical protein
MPEPIWASEEEALSNFRERTPLLTAEKVISDANLFLTEEGVTSLVDALDVLWGTGFSDDESGNVDAPTGHFFRVAHWIVTTDSQGFRSVEAFGSLGEAVREFHRRDEEYSEWDDDC